MRPTILHVGGVLYWTIQTVNPDTQVLKDADSTPSVAVRKNGSSVGDSVTVTKRSATTGLYDCSYNPAAEVEGDTFQLEEYATVTGTTTSSATYTSQFSVRVSAVERGTDGALTTLGTNAPANWFNAASISADAGAELAALVETYIVNEGDATAVMQAIANLIAADWVAGDASPLAIAAAVRTNLATELARLDAAISTRLAAASYISPANSDIAAIKAKSDQLTFSTANKVDSTAALDSAARVKLDATQPDYAPATAASLTSLAGKFTGITLLARWLGALAGKTADTTTRTEINATTAGAGYNETTDSLEAQKDSGGGGGGDATLAKQEEILTRLSTTTISVTGYAQLDIYGVLQLKRGHTATLTFTSSTSNIVSDLSAATTKVFFGIKDAAGRSWLSIEGTKLVNTGLQSVRFTISAALAAAMINGEHFFDVVAVYGYDANTTPKYTSLQPFTSGRAKVTDLYVDI